MRVFVCSPLRGKDGQPSQENIALVVWRWLERLAA